MTDCKLKRLAESIPQKPDFEVYSDEQNNETVKKTQKAKLKMRKCLVETSVEEAYAKRLQEANQQIESI